ncbi:MAG: glycoside hydrolase family 99-like domain-containing protein [Kiritimatiellales bacterium]|nr:glycoside hydrolase family 99-like domain-containing protein [Kiritimatiellales bacterium]MCF7864189.1 glycoside hydrolase family 99-like domain-containing protein [Kiritimatiellales bacterium]
MKRVEVAVYYFPNYHQDARNALRYGSGWTEWELVKRAEPRFPGHQQPKVPAWGETDEADPMAMAEKIDAAADHGIDTFIFDWYWYNDGAFLQRGLDEGFLNAPNNDRLKFAIMWANHDWLDIHPLKRSPRPFENATLLYPGAITPETFETVMDHCIETYFRHPSYWLIDGCPYFSFYALTKLMAGFGGIEQTRDLLDLFRAKVKAAGFPDLHLNAVVWDNPILPGETAPVDAKAVVDQLGFDSITSYVWIHHYATKVFPEVEYNTIRDAFFDYWDTAEGKFDQPYYPNVTMGWDSSPRTVQSDIFSDLGYPFMYTIKNNTPENFRTALEMVKQRLEESGVPHPFLTINAWNEWTEGSYLEPDEINGMGYLEAIRDVFKSSAACSSAAAKQDALCAVRG